MEWLIIFLMLFVLWILSYAKESGRLGGIRKRPDQPVPPRPVILPIPPLVDPPLRPQGQRPAGLERFQTALTEQEPDHFRTILEDWKKSITAMIKLAHREIKVARQKLGMLENLFVVETTVLAVEHTSRALLHCYGEKPESEVGQKEALELLSKRFEVENRVEFEKTLSELEIIYDTRATLEFLTKHETDAPFLTHEKVATIVTSGSKVVAAFTQIIINRFSTEIPGLELCPKCQSMDLASLAFTRDVARLTCEACGHTWVQEEPTTF